MANRVFSNETEIQKLASQLEPGQSLAQTYNINIQIPFVPVVGIQYSRGNVYEHGGNIVPFSSISATFGTPKFGVETNTLQINGSAGDFVGYAFGIEYVRPDTGLGVGVIVPGPYAADVLFNDTSFNDMSFKAPVGFAKYGVVSTTPGIGFSFGYTGIDNFDQPVDEAGNVIGTFYGFPLDQYPSGPVTPAQAFRHPADAAGNAMGTFYGFPLDQYPSGPVMSPQPFSYPSDFDGKPMGTFYGFGVDELSSLIDESTGSYSNAGSNQFDFSNATFINAGEFSSGIPGIGLSYASGGFDRSFQTSSYDFYSDADLYYESPSQLAGIGLSLTSDLGGGGYASGASFDFVPGQTTNSVFDNYGLWGYSPSFDYSGNGYSEYSAFFDDAQAGGFDFDGGYDPFQSFGQSFSDFGGFDFEFPVVLDLAGTGIKIDPLSSSNTYYDMAGDGYKHRTAWAGAGNGVLVLDLAGTGLITERNQVIFTDWDPTATSDMQAP